MSDNNKGVTSVEPGCTCGGIAACPQCQAKDAAHRKVMNYVMRLIDYGKGHPDPELDSLTIAEVTDRIIAVAEERESSDHDST